MPGSNHDDLRRNLSAILRLVRAEVNRQLDYLAVALGGPINILNTQLVVLGGFLAALLAVDPKRLQDGVGPGWRSRRRSEPCGWPPPNSALAR